MDGLLEIYSWWLWEFSFWSDYSQKGYNGFKKSKFKISIQTLTSKDEQWTTNTDRQQWVTWVNQSTLNKLTIFTTFTKVSFVTNTIKSWVVVIGWTQSFAHTWQGRTWICRQKLNIAVGQKCHSQNRANWGVFTKIGYLSGALEMHYDSSHFYKTHSSAQTWTSN